ncbi:hypothetical protein PVAND_000339 [Polypedilum vanderplanki]|uniref:Testicular haploid expressed protein n=1 Tax=Polypedilum vanderplanki TaxID=319348 RepID=A0A9J6BJS9_POLVA|nr:hypothetical protein PVAND_000339 [Polypedilum vanderplanki]
MLKDCPSNFNLHEFSCIHYFGSDHLKEERAKKFRCPSRRIRVLAQPKYLTRRILQPNQKVKKVQVIREYELPTRIKMLSIPKVRRLVASLDEYKNFISTHRIRNYDDLIQKSIRTMYSRLANVHMKKKRKPKKWTEEDKKRHCQWLQKRAVPKVYKTLPKTMPRKVVPLKKLQHSIFNLSRPRFPRQKYRPSYGYKSTVKDSAKLFIPSKRLLELSVAKKQFKNENDDADVDEDFIPFQVKPEALKYTITERVKQLATPKSKPAPHENSEYTKHGVIQRALKAATSARTLELAKPKEGEEELKPKPLVSKSALKAKPTPRILELSKPRKNPA